MDFQPLHKVPQYMNECAEVLNEEWKRSLTARLHSLEKSRDNFPVCLVLVDKSNGDSNATVIGHSMLSVVRGKTAKSCLVESVVVSKSHRGKGFGRIVMQKTEEFAASQGYEVMYLTTHDKQKFYEHLGYDYCSPVVSIGSGILSEHLTNKLIEGLNLNSQGSDTVTPSHPKNTKSDSVSAQKDNTSTVDQSNSGTPPLNQAPPPPPPPCPVAPPPPPPPCPVAPPPPAQKVVGKSDATRWDPSLVSWMKKKIS